MTLTSGSDPTTAAPAAPHSRLIVTWLRRHSRRLLVAGLGFVIVASLVTGGLIAWHKWTHPDLLPDQGDILILGPRPLDKATVAIPLTGTDTGQSRTLTFRSAHASLETNTAEAKVTFQICERRPGAILHLGIYDLDRQCASVTPLNPGATMTYPSHHPWAHQYLVATIAPTRSGEVKLTRVTFTYSLPSHHLPRPITDSIAVDVTVPVR